MVGGCAQPETWGVILKGCDRGGVGSGIRFGEGIGYSSGGEAEPTLQKMGCPYSK